MILCVDGELSFFLLNSGKFLEVYFIDRDYRNNIKYRKLNFWLLHYLIQITINLFDIKKLIFYNMKINIKSILVFIPFKEIINLFKCSLA